LEELSDPIPNQAPIPVPPRRPVNRGTGKKGIVLFCLFLALLFVAIYVPWFGVHEVHYDVGDASGEDESGYSGDDGSVDSDRGSAGDRNGVESTYTQWDFYDHSGKGYSDDEDDVFITEDAWENYYSLDNGSLQAWWGIILGMIFSVYMIVFGFIWPKKPANQRIILLFRSVGGIFLITTAALLIVSASKFVGLSISLSTSTSEFDTFLLVIAPLIFLICGIIIAKMSFKSIHIQYQELNATCHMSGSPLNSFSHVFSQRYNKISKGLIVTAILAISSIHVMPIVSNDLEMDDETIDIYWSTAMIFNSWGEYDKDMEIAIDDLSLVDTFLWLIFCFACIALFGSFINIPVFSRKAGSIIGLICNILVIFVILVVYFKILFIINVNGDHDVSEYHDFWENAWYGFNYLPPIMIIIMIVRSISYCRNSIKVFSSRKLKGSISHAPPYFPPISVPVTPPSAYPTPPPPTSGNELYQQRSSPTERVGFQGSGTLKYLEKIQVTTSSPSKKVSASMGNTIPEYTITHKLGSGGFATVYQAEDHNGWLVAIKMPKFLDETLDSSIYDKFESEAKMWNNLSHKNIVEFHEYVLEPFPCLVMEIMEGGSLKSLMDSRRLTTQEALSIFIQLVDAISYAHRMASIHRDIKPENVLFTRDGIPKLTDWGIGKLMASESTTKTVGAKGTLAYSAPEQISKKKYGSVDWSTDIFQIGIVGYEMLTGENPFLDEDPIGIMGRITNEEVKPPSEYNPEIPPQVDTVILKALEKRKEDRWRSADVMYDRLRRAMS